ncbi:hypothetical protein ACFXD5_02420 [Streptomyces sp. NPDC059385]
MRGPSRASCHPSTDQVKVYEDAFEWIVAAAVPVDDSREKSKTIMEKS